MGWIFLWLALALATQLWLCFRVARSSIALAIATFFLGSIAAVYTLFKHRGDPETSVTAPFLANLAFSVLLVASSWQLVKASMLEQAAQDQLAAAAEVAEAPPAPPAPLAAADTAAQSATPLDPVDAFSAELRNVGIAHTVTRLPATTQLPGGVVDAAQIDALASTIGASAPAGAELSVTLFRCDSVPACRSVAGNYMQQSSTRARVLQNGATLLVIPVAGSGEFDVLSASLASAFRKLPR